MSYGVSVGVRAGPRPADEPACDADALYLPISPYISLYLACDADAEALQDIADHVRDRRAHHE